MSHLVAPSILAADFAHLARDVDMLNKSKADRIHVDVMDGVFVPNISFGFPVIEAIKKTAQVPLDVHLMIVEPERYIERFQNVGANTLIIHIEACKHLHSTVQKIKQNGMGVGVAVNPHTAICNLKDIIRDLDQVLIMSVNPGFGGQDFIEHTFQKILKTKQLIHETQSKAQIGVDGGVDTSNAQRLLKNGANILVAGSSVFKSDNPTQAISDLKDF